MLIDSPRLIDSNLLAYAYDRSDPARRARALAVLSRCARSRSGAVSTQNLAEFWVVATRRIPSPLSMVDAERRIRQFGRLFAVLPLQEATIHEAIRGVRMHGFSYWDAQLWAAAKLNGCPVVLTEDLPSAPAIEGVHFLNPLDAGFDLESLG